MLEKFVLLFASLTLTLNLNFFSGNNISYNQQNVSNPSNTFQQQEFNFKEIEKQATKTSSGLKYIDLSVGTGETPTRGKVIIIRYTLRLTNGKVVDSTEKRGEDFRFRLGLRQVIKGLEEGVSTMKVDGKRRLIIPPLLGYGENGNGTTVPPGATLVFDVELVGVEL